MITNTSICLCFEAHYAHIWLKINDFAFIFGQNKDKLFLSTQAATNFYWPYSRCASGVWPRLLWLLLSSYFSDLPHLKYTSYSYLSLTHDSSRGWHKKLTRNLFQEWTYQAATFTLHIRDVSSYFYQIHQPTCILSYSQ